MKHLLLTLSAALLFATCGSETPAHEGCEEGCKKENCSHGDQEKSCTADCTKECCANKDEATFGIGDINPALDSKLMDISGTEMFIEELAKKNGTLLIFSCNTCPFVVGNGEKSQGWENRYNGIATMATNLEMGFALINSNEAKRDGDDSFDKMVEHAKTKGYQGMKYMMDANHIVADKLNAMTTPHVFLFDAEHNLVYTGAIDDNVDSMEEVKENWLADAMNGLAAGTEIKTPVTKHIGCSIKRVKKEESHEGHSH